MADMAPYIMKNGKWVDANNDLDIRNKDSLTSPTSKNVPFVYVRKDNDWLQIYPPTEKEIAKDDLYTDSLRCWQGSKLDNGVWGWAYDSIQSNMDHAAQGYFGTGSYSWETNVHKEFAGWLGLDQNFLTRNNFEGLGNVKEVKSVTMTITYNPATGYPAHNRNLCLVATNVPTPYLGIGAGDANNPTVDANRTGIFKSDNKLSFGDGVWTKTFTFTSSDAMNAFRDYMNGKRKNICSYSGTRPDNYPVWDYLDQGGRPLYMTQDYFKFKNIKISIDYTYEP